MDKVTVTQADRDAAEEFFPVGLWRQEARDDIAQAFARHRLAQTDAQMAAPDAIKHMVMRFLQWPLPDAFAPDAGISFEPEYNVEWNEKQGLPPARHKPTGTNLFDYQQAEQMVRFMVDGLASLSASNAEKAIPLDERKKIIAGGCIHTRKAAERADERTDLTEWQTAQSEWFDDTILEIVSEYAAWRDKQEPASNAMRDSLTVARNRLQSLAARAPFNSSEGYDAAKWADEATAALAGQGTTLDRQTVEQVLEPDDLLPSYCRLLDAMQGNDPDAVDTAFQASIEAVTKFGLLRASMNPTDMHSDGMNLP